MLYFSNIIDGKIHTRKFIIQNSNFIIQFKIQNSDPEIHYHDLLRNKKEKIFFSKPLSQMIEGLIL